MPEVTDANLLAMLNGGPAPAQSAVPSFIPGTPKPVAQPTAIDSANEARDAQEFAWKQQEQADKQAEKQGKLDEDARSKAVMLSQLKKDAKNIARLGRDANDNGGWGETGGTGAFSRDYGPKGTAGYSLNADIQTFKAKNAFAGLAGLGAQGIKLTPISNEEIKLAAASIANLDPDADHETFMRAVDETKQYYYDAIARIDPLEAYQTALENKESAETITAIAERTGGPVPDPAILAQAVKFTKEGGTGASFRAPPETPPETPPSGGTGYSDAFYAGVGDVAQGVGEAVGIVANPLNAGINALTGTNFSTDMGQTFRDATGAPQGNALASAINRAGTSALTMAGGANLANQAAQGTTKVVTNALASQPVQQFIGAVTGGASAEGARQAGAPAPVQVIAGLGGGLTGFSGANAVMRGNQAARTVGTNPAVAEAAQAKVPLMTTDVIPPQTVVGKTARKLGEVIPIAGTGGPRVTQQKARVEAVKTLARDFDIDEESLVEVTKDLTAERTKQITFFAGQKEQILENVNTPAATPRAIAMLDQQIAAASKVKTSGSQALVAKLNDFKTALQSGGNTLRELEAIRKEMGTAFKDPSLASIADAGTKAVKAVYGPLRDDIAATIRQVAGDETAKTWRIANARLSSMADELQSTALKSTLNKAASTPEDVAKLIFSQKPSQVRLLYNNLSSEGRVKAQGAIIARAMEKAEGNPDKLATELGKLSKTIGVFFQDADLARVQGLERTLNLTRRAQTAGVQPETGAQLTPWVAPTILTSIFGIKGGLVAAGGAGLLARLYESAPVRNALLKIGRTKPGSPQERAMIPQVMTAIAAANDNPSIVEYMKGAPGLSQAAASEDVNKERPIQP